VLRPSKGALGGQDAPGRFPASGRNAYPSGANAFFADVGSDMWSSYEAIYLALNY